MRYAQLNPKNLVINIVESQEPGSPAFIRGVHFSHEAMWNHHAAALSGQAAPLVALTDDQRPSPGQRCDMTPQGPVFVDDAEWLSGRAEQFRIEADEHRERGLADREKEARAKSADYAERAKKAGIK